MTPVSRQHQPPGGEKPRQNAHAGREGFVLIAALWLIVAFSAVSVHYGTRNRTQRLSTANRIDDTRARAAAESAIEHARSRLLAVHRDEPIRSRGIELQRILAHERIARLEQDTFSIGTAHYTVRMFDAGSRLNINTADEEQLRRFLGAFRVDWNDADRIAQSVADWRDGDDLYRARGAEREHYLEARLPGIPSNASFENVHEMSYVMGMTPENFAAIAPHLTLEGPGLVNVNTAPEPVLLSLPGMSAGAVELVLSRRRQGRWFRTAQELSDALSPIARQAFLPLMPEFLRHATFDVVELLAVGEGWVEGSPVRVRVTAQLIPAGSVVLVPWRRYEMTRRTMRIVAGVAIGQDSVTIVSRTRARLPGITARKQDDSVAEVICVQADPDLSGSDCVALFQEALARLQHAMPDARFRLHVALLPGVCETRVVPMPPLRASELALPIRRDAGRWFPGARQPRVIGAWRIPVCNGNRRWSPRRTIENRRGKGPIPVLAAAAPTAVLEALLDASSEAGAEVISAAPAVFAWTAFADELSYRAATDAGETRRRTSDRAPPQIVVACDGRLLHLLTYEDGWLSEMRRYRPGAIDRLLSDLATWRERCDEGDLPTRMIVLAPAAIANAIAVQSGFRLIRFDSDDTVEITARYARAGPRVCLVPEPIALEGRRWAARTTKRLVAAILVLLALASAAELRGLHRELSTVRALRLDLAPRVVPAMAVRDSLVSARERLETIRDVVARGPNAAELLVEIAMLLPDHSHITDLSLTPDTIRMNGEALRSAEALQALRAAATFGLLEFEGPIRREIRGDSAAIERFTIDGALGHSSGYPADSAASRRSQGR